MPMRLAETMPKISLKCQITKEDETDCSAPSSYYVDFMYDMGDHTGRAACGKHLGTAIHMVLKSNRDTLGAARVRPIAEFS